jgi:pimeloyl-ACP methyl ester carboxylesterase
VIDTPARGIERGVILMIHGASGNAADLWASLAGPLSEAGFRSLSADRPGHGWSERLRGPDAALSEAQARALRRAAQALGVERAIVVVHSLAGITGLAMALDAPDFVRALVLIAPVSHPWPGGISWYYSVGAHPLFGPPFRWLLTLPAGLAWLRTSVAGVFAPNPAPAGYIDRTRLPLVLRPLHFRANCEDVAIAKATTIALSPHYGEIHAPVEIVAGEADTVVANYLHADGLVRDVAGARLIVLPGVGHAPHHVAPERVVGAILEAERRAREVEAV